MNSFSNEAGLVGRRLGEARDAAGLSTREVAARLKDAGEAISHATIGNYERGVSSPTVGVLESLAKVYGRDVNWFFASGPTPTGVRFRKLVSRVKANEERQYLANASRWLEAYRLLERRVDKVLKGEHTDFRAKPGWTGQLLAEYIREAILKVRDNEPIYSVIGVLEQFFGIRVIELATPGKIDGFAAVYGEENAVVLNPMTSYDRNRLNAGHELAHVLFGDCDKTEILTHKEDESRVFEASFHLLMTESVLGEAFRGRSMVKLVQFKERYGVSLAAMVFRAEKLGFTSKSETEWLWRQFSTRGWRRNEPGAVRADRAIRFETMFEEATCSPGGILTRDEALKVMGVQEAEMQSRLNMAAGVFTPPQEIDNETEEGGSDPDIVKFPK